VKRMLHSSSRRAQDSTLLLPTGTKGGPFVLARGTGTKGGTFSRETLAPVP